MPAPPDWKLVGRSGEMYLLSEGSEKLRLPEGDTIELDYGRIYNRPSGVLGPRQAFGSILAHAPRVDGPVEMDQWEVDLILDEARTLFNAPKDAAAV